MAELASNKAPSPVLPETQTDLEQTETLTNAGATEKGNDETVITSPDVFGGVMPIKVQPKQFPRNITKLSDKVDKQMISCIIEMVLVVIVTVPFLVLSFIW